MTGGQFIVPVLQSIDRPFFSRDPGCAPGQAAAFRWQNRHPRVHPGNFSITRYESFASEGRQALWPEPCVEYRETLFLNGTPEDERQVRKHGNFSQSDELSCR